MGWDCGSVTYTVIVGAQEYLLYLQGDIPDVPPETERHA
jgi:hypothetical protein